jgi:cysteinyl-tRNA synthetase
MDSGQFRASNQAAALDLLGRFDEIFAVLEPTIAAGGLTDAQIDERVAERNRAKKARDFALADSVRNELLEQGVILEDTREGTRWKRK